MRCSGGREAQFTSRLVRPFAAPLNAGVRHLQTCRSQAFIKERRGMKLKRNLKLSTALALVLLLNCSPAHDEPKPLRDARLPVEEISEITYERIFGCDGECPMYKVVLRKDGTATYTGTSYAERRGKYESRYNEYYFKQIAELMAKNGYLNLKEQYGPKATDQGYIVTSVAYANQRKEIKNYGSEGPLELWAIEMALEGAMSQIRWEQGQ